MNDDQMDELLIQGAKDYNEPSTVPREEMWARISAARSAPRAAPVVDVRRPRHVWRWATVGVAAAAVLAVGIVIGRRLESRAARPATSVASIQPESARTVPTTIAANVDTGRDSLIGALRNETSATRRSAQQVVASASTGDGRRSNPDANLAYQLVVLRHLAGSEAMITAFRSSAERGEVDAQIASWSRELLSTTRLLEASPATQDPTMKRLLEDLDLVLVQISRYVTRGTVNRDDLDLIEQSITRRGIITKLRSAPSTLPVRNLPVGT